MRKIGITGGVGSGKSAVVGYLREKYGAYVILADELAHELEEPGQPCYQALVELFGEAVLSEDGHIHKKNMAALIFGDPEALAKVNAIVHPAVKAEIRRRIAEQEEKGTALFVLEAALLIEEKYDLILDELWYIYTQEAVRRQRLKDSRGYSEEKIDSIMAKQRSEEEFRAACNVVIDNSTSMEHMQEQVDHILIGV